MKASTRATRRGLALLAVLATVGGSLAAVSAVAATRFDHAVRRAVAGDRYLGPVPAGRPVEFSLLLRLPGQAELERFLAGVQDPASPSFHRYLTAAQFGRRFGLSRASIAAAVRALRSGGLRVVQTYPQRTALLVRGKAGDVERLLGTRLGEFMDPHGATYHRPLTPIATPAGLVPAVDGVAGLDTRPFLHPASTVPDIPPHPPLGGLYPADIRTAYGIQPLWDLGMHGEGQAVGILSLASFDDRDIAAWDRKFGITGPSVIHKPVGGGTTDLDIEVDLDVEMVRAVAPQAQIYDYEGRNGKGFVPILNQIMKDGLVKVVSVSWGGCDKNVSDRAKVDGLLRDMKAMGINVFVASGDSGAYGCLEGREVIPGTGRIDHSLSVIYPGDSQYVTSVGGTLLSVRADGAYLSEAAWEDVLRRAGGGGGIDPHDPRPSWQVAPGVDNPFSGAVKHREIPDVSGPADPDSGIFIIGTQKDLSTLFQRQALASPVGGTSAAAPFWAASTALIQQYAAQHGVPKLGPLNEVLYGLASTAQPFAPFHDVVLGRNLYYRSTPGWDFATGLGSPDVLNLARDAVVYLKRNPPP